MRAAVVACAVAALLVITALAEHHACSWDLGFRDPSINGWEDFCRAYPIDDHDGTYTYACENRPILGQGRHIGSWGKLRKKVLELDKPCYHGFAEHHGHWGGKCHCFRWVAACPTPVEKFPTCKGWDQHDDCEWPVELDDPPESIIIYVMGHFTESGLRRCGPSLDEELEGRTGYNESLGDRTGCVERDEVGVVEED